MSGSRTRSVCWFPVLFSAATRRCCNVKGNVTWRGEAGESCYVRPNKAFCLKRCRDIAINKYLAAYARLFGHKVAVQDYIMHSHWGHCARCATW